MPRRPLAFFALLASLALAAPGHATPPQVTDPSGDARVAGGAGADIVSVLFGTEGTTAKVRGRRTYTPDKLVVTVTYAGPVAVDEYVTHELVFTAPDCGEVYLERFYGGTYGLAACLDGSFDFGTRVRGSTLTYVVPFSLVGRAYLRPGAVLTDLLAYTAPGEPRFGEETNEFARLAGDLVLDDPNAVDATIDRATSGATYRIG